MSNYLVATNDVKLTLRNIGIVQEEKEYQNVKIDLFHNNNVYYSTPIQVAKEGYTLLSAEIYNWNGASSTFMIYRYLSDTIAFMSPVPANMDAVVVLLTYIKN